MLYYAEHFVLKEFQEAGLEPEITDAVEGLKCYLNQLYFPSKDIRLDEWGPDNGELFEIVVRVLTLVLTTGDSTIQRYMGMLEGNFPHENTLDRVKTAGEVLTVIAQKSNLINIMKGDVGDFIMVGTDYELEDIPVLTKHEIIYAPIPKNQGNRSDDHGSLILGNRTNHHNQDICTAHLDRMNSIPLQLNRQLLRTYSEKPKLTKEEKDKVVPADIREKFINDHRTWKKVYPEHWKTYKQKLQWDQHLSESYDKYAEIAIQKGNQFYIHHKYDKRGRTYAQGYHVTTQGSSFKKAIVQLKHEEVITMERSIKPEVTSAAPILEFQGEHRWLSNFAPVSVQLGDYRFPSVEHGYIAAKSHDPTWWRTCAQDGLPAGKLKKLGRKVVLRPDWDTYKLEVMQVLLTQKFHQEPYRTLLLKTGNAPIQEGNYWNDKFWGICLKTGEGKNMLGNMIMDVRKDLQQTPGTPVAKEPETNRVIIAGSRGINDLYIVGTAVRCSGFQVDEVVSGTAKGVDKLGECWAMENSVAVKQFPTQWGDLNAPGAVVKQGPHGQYNARAGMTRNIQMAEYADALIAIWDGKSTGTKHMIEHMKNRGKRVFVLITQ